MVSNDRFKSKSSQLEAKKRKCWKCGAKSDENNVYLFRYPSPGSKNALRCESWARFMFPGSKYSHDIHEKLYKRHVMLCDRHFNDKWFVNSDRSKILRQAAPDIECDLIKSEATDIDQTNTLDMYLENDGICESNDAEKRLIDGNITEAATQDTLHALEDPLIRQEYAMDTGIDDANDHHVSDGRDDFDYNVANNDVFDTTIILNRSKTYVNTTHKSIKKYGVCRCCLKEDIHLFENVENILECLNIEVCTDPRVSQLVCDNCGNFLRQASKFRNMVVQSQSTLVSALPALDGFDSDGENISEDTKIEEETGKLDEGTIVTNETERVERDANMTDNDRLEEDRGFSDLSDNTDIESDSKEIGPFLTIEDIISSLKSNDTDTMYIKMRENLCEILQWSTVMPFGTKYGIFSCIYCVNECDDFKELREHVETKHNSLTRDAINAALKRVPELILASDISDTKCRLCDKRFTSIDNLVEHLIEIHEKKYHAISRDPPHNILCFDLSLDELTCLVCEEVFENFKALFTHIKEHYGSYLCYQCGKRFMYKASWRNHVTYVHKSDKNLQHKRNIRVNYHKTCKVKRKKIGLPKNSKKTLPVALSKKTSSRIRLPILVPDETSTRKTLPVLVPEETSTQKTSPVSIAEQTWNQKTLPVLIPDETSTQKSLPVIVPEETSSQISLPVSVAEQSWIQKTLPVVVPEQAWIQKTLPVPDETSTQKTLPVLVPDETWTQQTLPVLVHDETSTQKTLPVLVSGKATNQIELCILNNTHDQKDSLDSKEKECKDAIGFNKGLSLYFLTKYVCQICDKKFINQSTLNNHYQTHYSIKLRCPLCNVMCLNKIVLRNHVTEKHPDVIVDLSDLDF